MKSDFRGAVRFARGNKNVIDVNECENWHEAWTALSEIKNARTCLVLVQPIRQVKEQHEHRPEAA